MDPRLGPEKTMGKSAHNPNRGNTHHNNNNSNSNNRQNSGTNDHSNKRLRPAGHAKESVAAAAARRLEDIRLVLKSTPSDEALAAKIEATKTELRAVERALAQEGTYLGIMDGEELEKRKYVLEKRCNLLREEKSLLQSLRTQLAEEEGGSTVAEQAEPRPPSSPASRRPGNKQHNNGVDANAQPSSPSVRLSLPVAGSPSGGATSAGSPSAPRRSIYQLAPPKMAKGGGGGIEDFLKKNSAAVGKKLAAGAGRSSS